MLLYIPQIVSIFVLTFVLFLIKRLKKYFTECKKDKNAYRINLQEVILFFKKQFQRVIFSIIIIFLLLLFSVSIKSGIGFLVGSIFSVFFAFILKTLFIDNEERIIGVFKKNTKQVINLILDIGFIIGLLIFGLGLFLISGFYYFTEDFKGLIGICLGACLIGLLLDDSEKNFNERINKLEKLGNDNNVDEKISFTEIEDIFTSYIISITSFMILTYFLFLKEAKVVILPLFLLSVFILCFIIGAFFIKLWRNKNIIFTFLKGLIISILLSVVGFYFIFNKFVFGDLKVSLLKIYLSSLSGFFVILIVFIGGYYLIRRFIKNDIIEKNIDLISFVFSILLSSFIIIVSFLLAELYGIVFSMISVASFGVLLLMTNIYYYIVDNIKRELKKEELPVEKKNIVEYLNSFNLFFKVINKTYFLVLLIFSLLALLFVYLQGLLDIGVKTNFYLDNYKIITGLFVGGLFSYFTALKNIKRREIYLIIIFSLILLGLILGVEFILGILVGSFVVGFFMSGLMKSFLNLAIKILFILAILTINF